MPTYKIIDFLVKDEVFISPDIQQQSVFPFTLPRAKRFFDNFQRETFNIDANVKSIFIMEGKENLPRHSFASGLMYSKTISEIQALGRFPDPIGSIRFECGGRLTEPQTGIYKVRKV